MWKSASKYGGNATQSAQFATGAVGAAGAVVVNPSVGNPAVTDKKKTTKEKPPIDPTKTMEILDALRGLDFGGSASPSKKQALAAAALRAMAICVFPA